MIISIDAIIRKVNRDLVPLCTSACLNSNLYRYREIVALGIIETAVKDADFPSSRMYARVINLMANTLITYFESHLEYVLSTKSITADIAYNDAQLNNVEYSVSEYHFNGHDAVEEETSCDTVIWIDNCINVIFNTRSDVENYSYELANKIWKTIIDSQLVTTNSYYDISQSIFKIHYSHTGRSISTTDNIHIDIGNRVLIVN